MIGAGWPRLAYSRFRMALSKKIDRALIGRALSLEFLSPGCNLILCGSNAVGKTMVAKNPAHAAVLAGHTVLFRTVSDPLAELDHDSHAARRHKFRFYARRPSSSLTNVKLLEMWS